MPDHQLLILGASARAACFSARRSSYTPYWIDQYGDHDLTENYPGECVSPDKYPAGILDLISNSPDVPFLYTGAMENHVRVLQQLEGLRTLMGNTAEVCRSVRDPWSTSQCFVRADIVHPQVSRAGTETLSTENDWLLKPLRSAGGLGITHYSESIDSEKEIHYLQEFIQGESRAGVFLGDGRTACLLGVTRQLTGEAFLNAEEFAYCGSVGPLLLDKNEEEQWKNIGHALVTDFGIKGLFGVDAIFRNGSIYP
ncbi:MAG: ATP-grasp domain-containing protein, partial [Gammaproteobacteria bacterium]|nr:ATP-grasp domain-containing protein [Gammaproteobacteria bacterium]